MSTTSTTTTGQAKSLLEAQLCFALYSASRTVTAAYRTVLAPVGLTYPQYLVLLALWDEDGLTVGQLGERLLLDSGTLSPLLRRLEEAGRVDRRRTSADGRLLTVCLTDRGRALRHLVDDVKCHLGTQMDLTPEESVQLRTLAQRVVDSRIPPHPGSGETPSTPSQESR